MLRKCQLLELKIASEIVRICEKYDIKYFLVAGTLLGAVRHSGFIPWDDDMDIGMTRNEYNRFLSVAPKELKKEFFLQTWDSDRMYGLSFAKIRLNDTKFIEETAKRVKAHCGIFVDIFPLDNLSDDNKQAKRQIKKFYWYKHLLQNKCGYSYRDKKGFIKRTKILVVRIISLFCSRENIKRKMLKCMTMYNNTNTKRVITFGGASLPERETLKRKWVDELSYIYFEGKRFLSLKYADEYLTHFYGDYMTPPPEEKRQIGHGITKIDLGRYEYEVVENE